MDASMISPGSSASGDSKWTYSEDATSDGYSYIPSIQSSHHRNTVYPCPSSSATVTNTQNYTSYTPSYTSGTAEWQQNVNRKGAQSGSATTQNHINFVTPIYLASTTSSSTVVGNEHSGGKTLFSKFFF